MTDIQTYDILERRIIKEDCCAGMTLELCGLTPLPDSDRPEGKWITMYTPDGQTRLAQYRIRWVRG